MIRILQAITPVQVGEGSSVGAVDLPVARERHTGFPVLPGPSLKGALRKRCARLDVAPETIRAAFGSEPGVVPLTKGTLTIGEGTLVALAVRCLTGGAALLTSPLLLGRLSRWIHDAPPVPATSLERSLAKDRRTFVVPEIDRVVLEDLSLMIDDDDSVGAWTDALRRWIGDESPLDRLLLVHDDVLAYATEAWLPVRTRAELDDDGVVRVGHLFTTESLPAESLMFASIEGDGADLLPADGELFTVGGQATVGAGRIAWYGERR